MNNLRSDDPGTGGLIGQRYALAHRLREEPWGEVWLARDQILGVEVGLKLLARTAPEWQAARKAFEEEAVLALRLRHPLILGVFYLGETEEGLYLVQEPFSGESLVARLTRQHRFSLPEALQLLEQVGQALALAHQAGVAHQSLSPLQILSQGSEVRLANFAFPPAGGDQAMHLELKAYDPPEVLQGDAPSAAGNVFSLGVLGFRLVAGSLPYPLTFDEPFPYRVEIPPVDLEEVPLPLQNFLLQCLAVEPEDRLPDAGAFLAQLRQVREQMRPGRREPLYGAWQGDRPPRVRQAAAQAGVWLGKVRVASQPLGRKVGEGAQASWRLLRAAPRRFWLGLGMAGLIILLVIGGLKTSRRTGDAPAAPATAAAPVKPAPLAGIGGGPPQMESAEPGGPPPAAPAVTATPGTAATPPAPEAKAAAQERYLLLAATYRDSKQAQALTQRLKARKYRVKIVKSTIRGKTLYQVQVGPVTGAQAAQDLADSIKEQEKVTPKVVKLAAKPAGKGAKKTAKKTNPNPPRGQAR